MEGELEMDDLRSTILDESLGSTTTCEDVLPVANQDFVQAAIDTSVITIDPSFRHPSAGGRLCKNTVLLSIASSECVTAHQVYILLHEI